MALMLKIRGGSHDGREIRISQTKKYLIGKADDCHLRPKGEKVSRYHCALMVDEPDVVIRDLGSSSGTFVNDERITGPVDLRNGDIVRVGPLEFEACITTLRLSSSEQFEAEAAAQQAPGLQALAAPVSARPGANARETDTVVHKTLFDDDGPFDLAGRVPRLPPGAIPAPRVPPGRIPEVAG
jgi:pSer/pThr/pTyr-binding forkhead associated (FHA) protein